MSPERVLMVVEKLHRLQLMLLKMAAVATVVLRFFLSRLLKGVKHLRLIHRYKISVVSQDTPDVQKMACYCRPFFCAYLKL